MIINKHIEVLPLHWASALINGDWSGYDDAEIACIKIWLKYLPPPLCVGNAYQGYHNDKLCDVAEYTFYVKE